MFEEVIAQAKTMISTFINQAKSQFTAEISSYEDKIKKQIDSAELRFNDVIKQKEKEISSSLNSAEGSLQKQIQEIKSNSESLQKFFSKFETELHYSISEVQKKITVELDKTKELFELKQQEMISSLKLTAESEFIILVKRHEEELGKIMFGFLLKRFKNIFKKSK